MPLSRSSRLLRLTISVLLLATATAHARANDVPDLAVVHRIKSEAFERSQVMEHLFQLSDVFGPRLTNSPGFDEAARWVVEQAEEWGLENAALEEWGPFGRGWSTSRFSAHQISPQYSPLIGVPLTWAPGTDAVVRGVPLLAPIPNGILGRGGDPRAAQAALERYKRRWRGQLSGRILLMTAPKLVEARFEPPARRWTDQELAERAQAPEPSEPLVIDDWENAVPPSDPAQRRRFDSQMPRAVRAQVREQRNATLFELNRFLVDEGVALAIHAPYRGDGGTLFPPRVARHTKEAIAPPPSIALTSEHYNRVVRLLHAGLEPELEVEVEARFHDETVDSYNVVAEIPGRGRADEVVILGAHLDDVAYATGATDNAAGCAVMMEAMRILKALDLQLDRTVRLVLWSGEEQGLLGSRAYVAKHFADPDEGSRVPAGEKVSAYYNLDNGTGKIRGVYLQGNDLVRPVFSSWLAPFGDLGAATVSIRSTFGTDHLPFDAVGIPGFQFIQDPVEYNSRTHHSNMDTYDRVQAADLMQAAAIVASFAAHTANRDDRLPRKPRER